MASCFQPVQVELGNAEAGDGTVSFPTRSVWLEDGPYLSFAWHLEGQERS